MPCHLPSQFLPCLSAWDSIRVSGFCFCFLGLLGCCGEISQLGEILFSENERKHQKIVTF
jgi:hypothetical protein